MQGLDIKDSVGEVLSVHLRDILGVIERYVTGWSWSLLHLWAVGLIPGDRSIVEYEEMAKSSPSVGASITEGELRLLAHHAEQVIDAVLVGNSSERLVRKHSEDDLLYQENDLVIEANDSSYWRIVSRNPEIIDAIRSHFKDVSPVPLSSELG